MNSEKCPNCGALENALRVAEENERELRAQIANLKHQVEMAGSLIMERRSSKYDISFSNRSRMSGGFSTR